MNSLEKGVNLLLSFYREKDMNKISLKRLYVLLLMFFYSKAGFCYFKLYFDSYQKRYEKLYFGRKIESFIRYETYV
jgi:hypothetical protein